MNNLSTDSLPALPDAELLNDFIDLDELQSHALCEVAADSPAGDSPTATCWGYVISNRGTLCTPGFTPRTGHFKNKFCPSCRAAGFTIDAARAKLLTAGAATEYVNPSSKGCWAEKDGLLYRVMNQTAKCKGVPLLLARDASAASGLGLQPLPDSFLLHPASGLLHLSVANGTLVPTQHLPTRRDALFVAHGTTSAIAGLREDSASSTSAEEDGSEPSNNHKRSRTEAAQVADHHATTALGFSGSNTLAALTACDDSMSKQLQRALDASAADPALHAYHEALKSVIAPLEAASLALKRATAAAATTPTAAAPPMMMAAPPPPLLSLSFEMPPLVPVPLEEAELLEAPVYRGTCDGESTPSSEVDSPLSAGRGRYARAKMTPTPTPTSNSLAARLEAQMQLTIESPKAATRRGMKPREATASAVWYYAVLEMFMAVVVLMVSPLATKCVRLLQQVPTAEGYLVVS